jgi:hypothetical protein
MKEIACSLCGCIIGDEVAHGDTWDGKPVCEICATGGEDVDAAPTELATPALESTQAPPTITNEQRMEVAKTCGYPCPRGFAFWLYWRPCDLLEQKDALIQKAAQLVRIRNDIYLSKERPTIQELLVICGWWERLGRSIADKDVKAIEVLVWELSI